MSRVTCSCGSAYAIISLAMMLNQQRKLACSYFATDINEHAAKLASSIARDNAVSRRLPSQCLINKRLDAVGGSRHHPHKIL
jgi:methylase of polypeptide subunit release factors